jgi:SAM-dependent methyltransferase
MSDGSKVVPEAEPLDDIILGDEDATTDPPPPPPPVQPKPSSPPPLRSSPRASTPAAPSASAPPDEPQHASSNNRRRANDAVKDPKDAQRKRPKMTLRIPDDEVSRPQPLSDLTPVTGVPAVGAQVSGHASSVPDDVTSPMMQPSVSPSFTGPPPPDVDDIDISADDTLELPPRDRRLSAEAGDAALRPAPVPAVGVDTSHEAGWTPFQPNVEDREAVLPIQPMPIFDLGETPAPPAIAASASGHPPPVTAANGPVVDPHEAADRSTSGGSPSQPPVSEEIPVDMDLSDMTDTSSDEIATSPRLPVPLDSEEIKLDDGDRISETGEVEVAPEDLVSVESLPTPQQPQPPPMKTAGKYPAYKPEAPTATSLIQGVPQPPQRPPPPPVAPPPEAIAPATPPAPPVVAASSQASPPNPPPAQPPSRRDSSPLIFVPPVGALAPPPMTDNAAAQKKKTRPWWEELFNDDFIRTMAKVTDAQIRGEVNFIEESLGCEAGAMILDLACGTGRHAVELAARGYQVVGFDLSLAMLARASDEAQDRKQKINFVQGDMREMTFEDTFDGVYSWNTSFGYFDEEKNSSVIARVHKALKKGGQFLLDVVNRDYIIRQAPSLAWFEGDGCICMDEMTVDFITSRMKVKRTLMMDDGRTKEIEYSIRAYALHELGKLLHDNGFRVAEVSGRTGTPGVFFGCESPRTLILAEKR